MNRVFIGLSFFNLLGLIVLAALFYNQQKVVYVDSRQLIDGYKGMQDARRAYQQKASSWKANIDTLTKEVQKQLSGYEKESVRMTTRERELARELIRTKQKQLSDYQNAINSQAQQEDVRMMQEVITQINAYLREYGDRKGYRIILAATEYGNVAYADDGLDITGEVLEGLNAEYTGQ